MVQEGRGGGGGKIKIRHVPYHTRRTLAAGGSHTEQIKDDEALGLGTVGRAGYIYNDGPGTIEFKIYDGKIWGDWIEIDVGEGINTYYEDNIWMDRIKIRETTGTLAATYALTINPGLEIAEEKKLK